MIRIVKGMASSEQININITIYIQSSVDIDSLFMKGATEQSETMNDIRRIT
jgi:hypothetical protein